MIINISQYIKVTHIGRSKFINISSDKDYLDIDFKIETILDYIDDELFPTGEYNLVEGVRDFFKGTEEECYAEVLRRLNKDFKNKNIQFILKLTDVFKYEPSDDYDKIYDIF